MGVGQRIRARRKQLGVSAEELATILNVSPSTVYRYENGFIEKIDSDKLFTIAAALDTTPVCLMGKDDSEQDAASTDVPNEYREAVNLLHALVDRVPARNYGKAAQAIQLFLEDEQ